MNRRPGDPTAWIEDGGVAYMTGNDDGTTRTDRKATLHRLDDTIALTHERIQRFEADSPDDQELLIKWIRTLGYLTGQYRKLLKDEDLDELAAELEGLKGDGRP